MRSLESTLHDFVDRDAKIFSSRHLTREFGKQVQILMIVAFENFAVHKSIEIRQIAYHPGLVTDRPADRDFDHVVVPVSVGIIALAIGRAVFLLRHLASAIIPTDTGTTT